MPLPDNDAVLPDIKLLRLFELLHANGSVTRAAELLGQSQPTVSIWLGQLRRQFGDPLFVRTPAGMQPTPRAGELIGPVREVLATLRGIVAAPTDFDPATSRRRFRVCMTDASHITLLPRLLGRLRAQAPGSTLEALRIDADTPRLLAAGEADLALGLVPGLEAGFYQQVLFSQDWICLASASHPRLGSSLSLLAWQAESHVVIVSGTGSQLLEAALRAQRVERRVVLALPGFLGLPAIVSGSDLVATLPRHIGETLAAQWPGLRAFACPVAVEGFTVKQHWHERFHHEPGNRWLRAQCAELFGQGRGPLAG
ncbi:LysR family transcriptional regulator [Derxia gummosa]|uniref:LysR family transcriptional regulator n=1 Tax=Derxia gummosa DSM 723 TaxID=1121388 RepID=A0A8B6X3B9_9BURK|nr:LysR family transcriptional regulator [Derxia gummosa]